MLFRKAIRREPRQITDRIVRAYERSCRQKQERLPLFADHIAQAQLPAAEEMERRHLADAAYARDRRNERAARWREVRARLFALPAHARSAVLDRYRANRWYPHEPGFLASIIWDALRAVPVSAEDVAPPADAGARIADLNDRARSGDTATRRRFCYSPSVMAWLCPDFAADEDHDRPRIYTHTNQAWHVSISERVRGYDAFTHNTDPSGERRSGVFEFLGVWFRFEVVVVGHADNGPSAAPWNIDLSRRIVWIGLADETVDLDAATYNGGWRPESSGVDCQQL
jgi:hypothetical protein